MYAVFALKSLKRHAPAHRSNTFLSLLESHASGAKFMRSDQNREEMCGMMGNLAADRRRRKEPTVMTGGSPLSRLPTARRGGAHETGRTYPIPQYARGGDGRPHVRRVL